MYGVTAGVERTASAWNGIPVEAGSLPVGQNAGAVRPQLPAGYRSQGRRELAGLAFVERCENVILLGPPDVGKTHLAVALGVKATDAGHRVLFMPLDRLVATPMKAKQENRLERQLQQLSYSRVLILDEIGYFPMTREEVSLFFRLLNRRYEKVSLILTSNKGFADWEEMFGDNVLATVILDRLLHHSTILNIKGKSYRLKEKRKAGVLAKNPTPINDNEMVKNGQQK